MEYYTVPPRLRNSRHHRCRHRMGYALLASVPSKVDRQPATTTVKPIEIQQVWMRNLIPEFHKIKWAIDNGYDVVALDTEFPGSPYVPDGVGADYRRRSCEDHYAVLKMNVDRLKIIQVGITLMDRSGNLPDFGSDKQVIWEFNLSDFDIDRDEYNKESVELLAAQGIDFQLHKRLGIRSMFFSCFMRFSGLVGRSAAWITFQGGIDLAYLLKILMGGRALPDKLEHFNGLVRNYFGVMVFDVKRMMTQYDGLYGGLNKVAETLKVERDAGESHRAGSDSLLTAMVFHKIVQVYFPAGQCHKFAGQLHNFVQVIFRSMNCKCN